MRQSLETVGDNVRSNVKEDSAAGKEIKTIVQEGVDCIAEQQLNVKLADAHGWPVVEAMCSDKVLAASGNENLDKKLRMAQKKVAAEKEAAAKEKGTA